MQPLRIRKADRGGRDFHRVGKIQQLALADVEGRQRDGVEEGERREEANHDSARPL